MSTDDAISTDPRDAQPDYDALPDRCEPERCARCGKPVLDGRITVANVGAFCSPSCRNAFARYGPAPVPTEVDVCPDCHQDIDPVGYGRVSVAGVGRFCSQACWRAYDEAKRPKPKIATIQK